MCGGWRTVPSDYRPTPQPGDFVQIWVCAKCHKRGRAAIIVTESSWKRVPKPLHRWSKDKSEYAIRRDKSVMCRAYQRKYEVGPCCTRTKNHIKRVGRVDRSTWSRGKHGEPKRFFLIVYIPSLKKRVWCDLEAIIHISTSVEYLIDNIGGI